jgi:predicted amidohydrolase YtcJ
MYATLLLPVSKTNTAVDELISQLLSANDKRLKYNTLYLLLRNKQIFPDTLLNHFAAMNEYRYELFTDMKKQKMTDRFPVAYKNTRDIAKSKLLSSSYYEKPDSVQFLDSLPAVYKGKQGLVYFFRYKMEKDDPSWKLATAGLMSKQPGEIIFEDDQQDSRDRKARVVLGKPESGLGGGLLDVRSVKLYADGALGSRGAALLEPYADDAGNLGLVRTPPEEMLEAARFALAHGFQVGIHAIGDRANRMVLDIYEKAFAERPEVKDPRFRIEHAQILDALDVPRFGRLGVLASMQGIHCPSDRPWAPKRLGDARVAEGAYVWRKLLDSGARIANGTDAPVEDVSPIQNFHASVTRAGASGQPPGGFDPAQKLTRAEALRTMTLDAAYSGFAEGQRGSIEVGKLADLVVLSQDILSVPDEALLKTEVLATILDGRVRYEKK